MATRVRFVCLGNICRSPTAHGVLRHKLRAAGWHERVSVDSAGTHGWHAGSPPDERALDLSEDACDGLLAQLATRVGVARRQ